MSYRLGGINPLSYVGVQPLSPPEMIVRDSAPTPNDFKNFNLGTLWLDTSSTPETLYVLVSVVNFVATWVELFPAEIDFVTNAGTARSDGQGINLLGGNVVTTSGAGDTVTVSLTNGTNGQVIIAGGVQPVWGNIASSGGTVNITYPGPNQINLEATGVAGLVALATDSGTATPTAGTITIAGGSNIGTSSAPLSSTVTIDLDNSPSVSGSLTAATGITASGGNIVASTGNITTTIGNIQAANLIIGGAGVTATTGDITASAGNINVPAATTDYQQGYYVIDNTQFMHNFGLNNVFLGGDAGDAAILDPITASDNVFIGTVSGAVATLAQLNAMVGSQTGRSLTVGGNNAVVGARAFQTATNSNFNAVVGDNALGMITTGSSHVAIGSFAGFNYSGTETSNIVIGAGNMGVLGESHILRLGRQGNGIGQQNVAFIGGIYANTFSATNEVVFVDSAGRTGSSKGTDGQVIIGSTAGAPIWSTLTAGANITITNAANSITIAASGGGGGGASTFVTNSGTATQAAGSINMFGTGIVTTTGAGSTVTTKLTNPATNGMIPIASATGGHEPIWANLTAGSNVTITNGDNTITIASSGGGGGGDINFITSSGTATSSAGNITFTNGSNITMSGAGAAVTVNLVNSPSVSGSVTAGTGMTSTTGDITATNGDLISGDTAGAIASNIAFKKSRAGGVITSGDALGQILWQGHDGTQYITGSQITSTNSGTVAANRIASDLKFFTHPNSTTPSTLRMTIAPTGDITIATPDSGTALTITGGGQTITAGGLLISAGGLNSTGTTTLASLSAGALVTNSSGVVSSIPGTVNQVLVSNGAGVAPSFQTLSNTDLPVVDVAHGGTGSASHTAYAVICGGTTSTNPLQSVASVGTAGQVLTSNGAGALPTFQAAGGGGSCQTACTATNTGNGQGSMAALTSGTNNSAFGSGALSLLTSGNENTGIGQRSLLDLTTGSQNTALGRQSGNLIQSGSRNVFLGYQAGAALDTSSSDNIIIGYTAGINATSSNNLIIGAGTGTGPGQLNSTTICGITGKTTAGGIAVLINSSNLLGTTTSSRRFKQNIQDMASHSNRLHQLRPVIFNRPEYPDYVEPGLIAEEVYEVMPEIVTKDQDGLIDSVQYHLLPAMLLNEIQKLKKELAENRDQINSLSRQLNQRCSTCK